MSARAQAILEEIRARVALTIPASYIPHTPHPQQAKFLALDCLEALYGGAAGGGKSDALLMAALQYVHVPGYSALILRRTYQDLALPGAIMDRAQDWLRPTAAHWDGLNKRWTFPSGATLSFGYLNSEKDRFRYQSAEFQFIGPDELTQFPEAWFRYMFSRLRKPDGMPVPLRMRGATNPGNIGHEWVKRRYLDDPDGPPFIPAKLADNPSVDAASYTDALARLDPATRKQLLEGIWVRDSSGLVYRYNSSMLIEQAPECPSKLLALDFGYVDSTAFVLLGWRPHDPNLYVLRAWKRAKKTPGEIADEASALELEHRFEKIVGDLGGLGKGYAEEARKRHNLPIEAADKNNKRGYIDLFNGDMATSRIKVVRTACEPLIKEWCELPWTEDRSEEADGFDNHCSDATLYGWRAAYAYLAEPAKEKPEPDTEKAWEAEEAESLEKRISELSEERDWRDF